MLRMIFYNLNSSWYNSRNRRDIYEFTRYESCLIYELVKYYNMNNQVYSVTKQKYY